jgi:hypothetical protein
MASLQELLSKGANQKTKSAVAQAETAIGIMRKNGYIPQAEEFEGRIRNSIVNKNGEAFGGTLKQLYAFQKKAPIATPETKEQPPEYGSEELAMRIQDSIALADERGIDLPNSDLSRLSSLVAKGDTKKASQQLAKVSSFIDKSLAIQTEEEKKPKVLADGTQIEIGSKSGTRYMGGQPVSKGAINSDVFNSMYQKEPKAETEAMGVPFVSQAPVALGQTYDVAPVEGVVAQPEVYAQAVKEKPSGAEEALQMIQQANKLYQSGDKAGASAVMQALQFRDPLFSGARITPENVGEYFVTPSEPAELKQQTTETKQEVNLPSSIDVKGKTYNRPKEFTDQQWDEYIKTIQSQNK